MKKDRKRNNFYIVFGITSAIIILGVAVSLFIFPPKAYSDREGRPLKGFPSFTAESLKTGAFRNEIEAFARDQFYFRDLFGAIRGEVGRIIGNREMNGVFLLESGRLAEQFIMPEEGRTAALRNAVREFSERHEGIRQYFLLAPTAISLYRDELPKYAEAGDQDAYLDLILNGLPASVEAVDVRPSFREEPKTTELYYRTDEHWTTDAARLAAAALLLKTGSAVRFTDEAGYVTDSFIGSLAKKSGFTPEWSDRIKLYQIGQEPDRDFYFTVTYTEEQISSASVYAPVELNGSNPYRVFLGKDAPEIRIRTSLETGKRLLLLKGSYANAVVPFLVGSFDEIVIIDPVLYRGDLEALIEEEDFTDAVFLYDANSLSQDTSLIRALRNTP